MIGVHLQQVDGTERSLGIRDGTFVEPDGVAEWRDLRHLWATNGLVDAHGHLEGNSLDEMTGQAPADVRANAARQLDGGVLVVGDKGTRTNASHTLFDEDADTRPEIHTAGRVIANPGGYYEGFAVEVDGPDLPAAVAEACVAPATWVKLIGDWPRKGRGAIPNFAEDELRSAVAEAHSRNCRVAIHTAAPDTPSMAVAAGVDSIEHGLFLTADDVRRLGDRGGSWVPTLVAMTGLVEQLGAESSGGRLLSDGVRNASALLGLAVESGVHVLGGTDLLLPHGAVAEEIVALRDAGLDDATAFACATTSGYAYFDSDRAFAPGRSADIVAFESNPLDDVAVLRHPAVVVRAGRFLRTR